VPPPNWSAVHDGLGVKVLGQDDSAGALLQVNNILDDTSMVVIKLFG
jgi:hypothetical protein